jgi:hypothetical protein
VTSDLDTYRAAVALIDQHRDSATIIAAMRADALLDEGDIDGVAVWRRIMRTVGELQRVERIEGEAAR